MRPLIDTQLRHQNAWRNRWHSRLLFVAMGGFMAPLGVVMLLTVTLVGVMLNPFVSPRLPSLLRTQPPTAERVERLLSLRSAPVDPVFTPPRWRVGGLWR